jgi:hypothetical protein
MGGLDMEWSLPAHIQRVSHFGKKKFKKKFGWYKNYIIPLGWWLGMV